ncbi:MAG: (d)CMP kinase, partial [Sphingomicrobium sp.]
MPAAKSSAPDMRGDAATPADAAPPADTAPPVAPAFAPVIAVDGPAASGKGTIARAIAAHFKLPHMDTGLLYRAVALNLWRWGG